jgi:hypothetical protein
MIHGFQPRQHFHFYPFIANSLRQGNLQNPRGRPDFVVASSLWLEFGAQRRRYNSLIGKIPTNLPLAA